MSGYIVVSPDGKSRTVTVSGTDANGNKIDTLRCMTRSSDVGLFFKESLTP